MLRCGIGRFQAGIARTAEGWLQTRRSNKRSLTIHQFDQGSIYRGRHASPVWGQARVFPGHPAGSFWNGRMAQFGPASTSRVEAV